MKKSFTLFYLASFTLLLNSCGLQRGYLVFQGRQNEIIAPNAIKSFMKQNPNPSIVLKVPVTENRATQAETNSYIYSDIEKELALAGFRVKDRGLFNEVIGKSKEINYSEIKRLTDTDLLLELVTVSTNIEYGTNRFFISDGKQKIVDYNYKRYGAIIEFKLTIIENNQYGGSYSFFYTPCTDSNNDCNCVALWKKVPSKIYPHIDPCTLENNSSKPYEYISQNSMSEFVRNGVRQMINEIRK